jgi:hypothetical protein
MRRVCAAIAAWLLLAGPAIAMDQSTCDALNAGKAVKGTPAVRYDKNHDGYLNGLDWVRMGKSERTRCLTDLLGLDSTLQAFGLGVPPAPLSKDDLETNLKSAQALVPKVDVMYKRAINRHEPLMGVVYDLNNGDN